MMQNNNAKYAFYYLLALVALIFVTISVGIISFGYIDRWMVDVLSYGSYSNPEGSFRFAISALLIAAPIFYVVSSLIHRGLRKQELSAESGIRRWLTYFIILVSSLIILGVFISIINNFLAGELTGRFFLKSATIFIIAATVFSFYFYDIKRADTTKEDKVIKIFFFASLGLVLIAFVSAWFLIESPSEVRNRRLDELTLNNVTNLENAVNYYYERQEYLPDNIEVLKRDSDMNWDIKSFMDLEAVAPVTYEKVSEEEFNLCADFRTSTYEDEASGHKQSFRYSYRVHGSGYHCFQGHLRSLNRIPEDIQMY